VTPQERQAGGGTADEKRNGNEAARGLLAMLMRLIGRPGKMACAASAAGQTSNLKGRVDRGAWYPIKRGA